MTAAGEATKPLYADHVRESRRRASRCTSLPGVNERQTAAPARSENTQARRGCDDLDAALGPAAPLAVAAGRPAQELRTEDEPRFLLEQHECSVGELVELGLMRATPFRVQHVVELVGARRAGELEEALVVGVPALRARRVSGSERGRLVEEEQAGVPVRRHRPAAPVAATDLQTAR